MKFKLILLSLFLTAIIACGYKNNPKSKDNFVIKIPDNISIINTDNGIKIANPDKNYSLIIERALKGKNCIPDFQFIKTITPKKVYVDENVIQGQNYLYRFYYLDNKLKINSKPKIINKVYLPPIEVKSIKVEYLTNDSVSIKPVFSKNPLYYKVFLNEKLMFQTKKTTVKLILEDISINKIKLIPYDEFDNKGKIFIKQIINKETTFVPAPEDIKVILGEKDFIIIWDEVKNAKGYNVYNSFSKETKRATLPKAEFKRPPKGCYYFKISAFNEFRQSKIKTIDFCIP